MNREEIMNLLPHRAPMLLVDETKKEGEYCISSYLVKGDEPFLSGHFPGMPVVPGVILCEMMGQGSALLLNGRLDGSVIPMFAGMENVRFKQIVRPGDTVVTKSRLIDIRANVVFIDARATVNGKLCCSAHLTVALVKKEN